MQITFPQKLYGKTQNVLFEKHRYKILYGGRGSSKSWCLARAALIRGVQEPLLILCAREIQSSIDDSIHSLLAKQIKAMNLGEFYEIQKTQILGKNGTKIIFAGLKHNIDKIKSAEAVDICLVEEAAAVSKHSWSTLIPTIRKKGSEIWVSFNPELDTDETYVRFVLNSPPDAVVIKMNWQDNPWFHETELPAEKDALKITDYDAYLNVWEGHCRKTIEGAVYAKEIRHTIAENRVCRVPPLPGKPIDTFWDLGKSDYTSIWFVQFCGMGEYRIVDFYQNQHEEPAHYFKLLQSKGYLYGFHYLPHDASHERLGMIALDKQFKAVFPERVKVLERIKEIRIGLDAARTIFPYCYFDEEKCADGLQALRRYKYKVDASTGRYSSEPVHDDSSHAADAFRYIAMGVNAHKPKTKERLITVSRRGGNSAGAGWMNM